MIKVVLNRKSLVCSVLCAAFVLTDCGREARRGDAGDVLPDSVSEEDFHADNDIAMTVRSIVDAIRVGEPLDTAGYNFDGVLTDGIGRPLYTNLQGLPGEWDVDVLSDSRAVIRNVDIGDLLPDDLESYIAASLELTAFNVVDSLEYQGAEGAETTVYDFGGGYLRYEVRNATAANGLEGPLVRITATRDIPAQ